MWHTKWRVPHQPLKQQIYRSDKVIKKKKKNNMKIPLPPLLCCLQAPSSKPPPPPSHYLLHAAASIAASTQSPSLRSLPLCISSLPSSTFSASSGSTSSSPPSPRRCHYASVSTPSLHASWVVHLQQNHPPLNLDLSSEIPPTS